MKTIESINKKFDEIREQIMWVFLQSYEAGLYDYKNKTIAGKTHSKQLLNAEKLESKLLNKLDKVKINYTQQILSLIEELEKGLPKKKEEYRCFKNKGWNDKNRCEHTLYAYNIGKIDGQNFTIDQMRASIKEFTKSL